MNVKKLGQLREWRDRQARKEGVEVFRVLSNQTIEEIVLNDIKTEEGLLGVKGIAEKKLAKYGREILTIMNSTADVVLDRDQGGRASQEIIEQGGSEEKIFSVSVFLDLVNTGLRTFEVKIKGEVSSVDERGGNYYFGLKDKEDGSTISCLIWKTNYRLAGVELKEGMEVMIHGFPSIYKPNGRISFQADSIELVGEGALKKQYEELKKKLEQEGLFLAERKKPIPLFPHKIGLITSRQGEAIFDFRTNLGKFGFQIEFFDSRVEGVQAVPSLLKAVRYFKNKDIDVLVLVRGGGSLESLLSFNNEMLVREIANFGKPVVSGIGHEQDVSLVDLVADRSCSTPTGAAKLLSYSWEQALARVNLYEKDLFGRYLKILSDCRYELENLASRLRRSFSAIFEHFRQLEVRLKEKYLAIGTGLESSAQYLIQAGRTISLRFASLMVQAGERIDRAEAAIKTNDPARQLALGFSLVRLDGKIVKSVSQVSLDAQIKVELQDGEILSRIEEIKRVKSKE